jgi:hypothetical protein
VKLSTEMEKIILDAEALWERYQSRWMSSESLAALQNGAWTDSLLLAIGDFNAEYGTPFDDDDRTSISSDSHDDSSETGMNVGTMKRNLASRPVVVNVENPPTGFPARKKQRVSNPNPPQPEAPQQNHDHPVSLA